MVNVMYGKVSTYRVLAQDALHEGFISNELIQNRWVLDIPTYSIHSNQIRVLVALEINNIML